MEDNYEIHNVSEFIHKIFELNKVAITLKSPSVSSISFYRGQANSNWELEPKLYREKLLEKESVLISEFLRIAPNNFDNLSYFDKLVKMQHYGLPTRLLDTTQNPLVALFFACYDKNENNEDGNVYVFPQLPVLNHNNGFVSLTMKYVFEYSGITLDIERFTNDVVNDNKLFSAHTRKHQSVDDVLHTLCNIPYMAVLPTLNNPRIFNQDGAFFLFGMKIKNIKKSTNPGNLNKIYYDFDTLKFNNDLEKFWKNSKILRVPSKYKSLILSELSSIGITRNKMFPELEYQADFITNMIKTENNKR